MLCQNTATLNNHQERQCKHPIKEATKPLVEWAEVIEPAWLPTRVLAKLFSACTCTTSLSTLNQAWQTSHTDSTQGSRQNHQTHDEAKDSQGKHSFCLPAGSTLYAAYPLEAFRQQRSRSIADFNLVWTLDFLEGSTRRAGERTSAAEGDAWSPSAKPAAADERWAASNLSEEGAC